MNQTRSCYYISFACKYYTLWHVATTHIIDTERGYEYDNVNATYIKNISMDFDAAQAKHPGVAYNPMFVGKRRSFSYTANKVKIEHFEPSTFHFGRYKHQRFEDCKDYGYMRWYFEQQEFADGDDLSEFKPLIAAVEANTEYKLYGKHFVTESEYEWLIAREAATSEAEKTIDKGYAIVNVDSNWLHICKIDNKYYGLLSVNTYDINFAFNIEDTVEYMPNYYSNGGYKPAINGKGKNLKGNRVKLYGKLQNIGDVRNIFLVNKFEILK